MGAPKRVTPKKVTTKPAKPAFDPKKALRERVSASEKVARRDAGIFYAEGTNPGPRPRQVPAGQYVPLLRDVSSTVREVRRTGNQGDFDLQGALKNTFKGKQYGGEDWFGRSISVKAGTVAGPKTARNNSDLAKAAKMNAERDKRNMLLRRGKGR